MSNIIDKINENSKSIIEDNNFLFAAFENRLTMRLVHIFEKYKIPMNKNILKKNMEEYLINNLLDINTDTLEKYTLLIENYEKIINHYVETNTSTTIIKKATMEFIEKINEKNKGVIKNNISNNFIEYINSIIYVYDNNALNNEVVYRINDDIHEIISEFNRNNYNFVIESINKVIKNIIENM